jgi:hypothetical protein
MKYRVADPAKALYRITIDVGEQLAALLLHLEDAVHSHPDFLPNQTAGTFFKKNPMMTNNTITIVSKVFKTFEQWDQDHGDEVRPVISQEDDVDGWSGGVGDFVHCPRDFCKFYRLAGGNVEEMQPSDLNRDDCIQARIAFSPYAFTLSDKSGACGVRAIMEDVVLIRRLARVSGCLMFEVTSARALTYRMSI